jgi:YidC/Oxa1 family membrane protein insertase
MNNIAFETWDLPILYPLVAIYKLFETINVPHPLTYSIIVLTIFIRFLLYPLITSQIKSTQRMQKLAPELSRIKDIHKGDSKRIQQETMRLYKEHGVNPAAGCLPVLIQLPVIFILYSVLLDLVKSPQLVTQKINEVITVDFLKLTEPINQSFFFFPLGKSPAQVFGDFGILIFLVPLITGVLQFIQSKMMFTQKKDENVKKDDFASMFQTQTVYIFPIMIAVFSYTLPIGLSLYWNVFTLFGIIQQYRISGWGGLSEYINKYGRK